MFDPTARWTVGCLLVLTALAAASDVRAGVIPNRLTLSALAFAPLVHGILDGAGACVAAIGSALLCGLAPLVLFVRGAIGGGDVKLFAAVGALAGAHIGLETQFATYAIGLAYALGRLARRGELGATCLRAWALLVAPLARGRVAPPPSAAMSGVRLGLPAFAAAALVLGVRALEAAP